MATKGTIESEKFLKLYHSFSNDNMVLGCTHYPLIKNEIKEILGDVNFFDGSFGVAKRVKYVANGLNLKESTFKLDFIDSSNSKMKEQRFFDIIE